MSPGPRSTSIEEPPSFREPEKKNRLLEGIRSGRKIRPITSTGATRTKNRNKLFSMNQQKNQRLMNQMLEKRKSHMVRFQSCRDEIIPDE